MFNFFCKNNEKQLSPPQHQPDALNETVTQIAIELIEEKGGKLYLESMKRLFKASPGMIDDVAPEYRELLEKVLIRDER